MKMQIAKAILKNTTYLLTSEIIVRVITLFQVIILVRYLGKNDYGVWSLIGALPGILLVITDLGLHTFIIRKVSQHKNELQSSFQEILTLKAFLSVIFLGSLWLIVNLLAYSDNVKFLIYVASVTYTLHSVQGLFGAIFRATQRFIYDAILQLASALCLFAVILITVLLDYGLPGLVFGQLLAQVLILLFCFVYYFNKCSFSYPLFSGFSQYLSTLRKSLPFAVIAIVLPIFYQIDIVMLSKMSGHEATGIYTAAYKIILMFMMFSRLFSRVLFPTLSNLFVSSNEGFRKAFFGSYRAIALVAFPTAFGLFLLSDRFILLLFKGEFADSILPLQIMAFSLLFSSLHMPLSVSLNSSNSERQVAFVIIVVTASNIVMNFILIPRLAYIGASIATLISEMMRYGGNYYYFRKRLFKIKFTIPLVKLIGACLIMSSFIVCFSQIVLPLLILMSALIYLFLIWLFRIVSRDEVNKLINLFRKETVAPASIK